MREITRRTVLTKNNEKSKGKEAKAMKLRLVHIWEAKVLREAIVDYIGKIHVNESDRETGEHDMRLCIKKQIADVLEKRIGRMLNGKKV